MSTDRPLGINTDCNRCGQPNQWTGRERERVDVGFGGTRTRILLAEIRCSAGHTDWIEVGEVPPSA